MLPLAFDEIKTRFGILTSRQFYVLTFSWFICNTHKIILYATYMCIVCMCVCIFERDSHEKQPTARNKTFSNFPFDVYVSGFTELSALPNRKHFEKLPLFILKLEHFKNFWLFSTHILSQRLCFLLFKI